VEAEAVEQLPVVLVGSGGLGELRADGWVAEE
jgi:hypothetical protein